jgi:hemerythrin-like metal-binding protein
MMIQNEVFPWNESFETGIPNIDKQHRRLVYFLNLLASHVASQSDVQIIDGIFNELADYAAYHFQTEEAIWHQYLAKDEMEGEHKLVHNSFIETVTYLKNEKTGKTPQKIIQDIISFLTNWLASHILESDQHLARIVLGLQSGLSLEDAKQRATQHTHGAMKGLMQATLQSRQAEIQLKKSHDQLEDAYRKLQETQGQLLQSEKMASIGQLAAGVAHEINNPIGYVYSNIGSLQKYLDELFMVLDAYERAEPLLAQHPGTLEGIQAVKQKVDMVFLKEDLAALMCESREGIMRVKKIVQNLKDFSRAGSDEEWQLTDLRQGLDSTLNIVWNEIKYKAEVNKEYNEIADVECLPSQINQVFMNLMINAAQAIEERGTITIRTGIQDDKVWVEVSDTGNGVAPEHLNRIFEPFFTTKPVGKGTGLGLSVSYSIIQIHHGNIEVTSEVGCGTTFRIWLPVKQPKVNNET